MSALNHSIPPAASNFAHWAGVSLMDRCTSFSLSGFGGRPPLFFGSSMDSVYVMQKVLAKLRLLNHNNHHRNTQPESIMNVQVGQQVKVWINSIIGAVPAVVVRDLTGDAMTAAQANAMPDESVFECRYTAGPYRGAYTNVPARGLRQA